MQLTISYPRMDHTFEAMPMVPRNRAGDTEADTAGISLAEHLLVWSWRKIVTGRADCPLIAWEFKRFCGEDAAEVRATLCAFLRALAYAGRRRLQIGYRRRAAVSVVDRCRSDRRRGSFRCASA